MRNFRVLCEERGMSLNWYVFVKKYVFVSLGICVSGPKAY